MDASLRQSLDRLGVTGKLAAVSLGGQGREGRGGELAVHTPIDGSRLATFAAATEADVQDAVAAAGEAFRFWRSVPAPRRGEFVRRYGEELRTHKEDLAAVVTWEAG